MRAEKHPPVFGARSEMRRRNTRPSLAPEGQRGWRNIRPSLAPKVKRREEKPVRLWRQKCNTANKNSSVFLETRAEKLPPVFGARIKSRQRNTRPSGAKDGRLFLRRVLLLRRNTDEFFSARQAEIFLYWCIRRTPTFDIFRREKKCALYTRIYDTCTCTNTTFIFTCK